MLPISLSLSNFLSYRDAAPPLHLDGVRLACLCGPNGHGKSALLDAMTWALWGKARGQRNEQLLHHGQIEMRVELVFDAGGSRYRVTRRYSQSRSTPQSSLELAAETAAGEFRPVTADSIRATSAEIERLVNMDYDTFVNSAFLVQGRADAFTMSTPAQRKEALAKVLALGLYDDLADRARLRKRGAEGRSQALALNVERLRERASRGADARAELADAERALAESEKAVAGLAERMQLLRERAAQLERLQAEQAERAAEAKRAHERRRGAESESSALESRIAGWRRAVEREAEIERGAAALRDARERAAALRESARQAFEMQAELAPLERAVAEARARLESEIAAQRRRVDAELAPQAESLPSIQLQEDELSASEQGAAARRDEAEQAEERRIRLTSEAQTLRQANERIAEEGKDARLKIQALEHGHPDGDSCPLCETPLGAEGAARLLAKYRSDIEKRSERYRQQQGRADLLEREAKEAEAASRRAMRESDAERKRVAEERGRLARRREEAEQAAAQLPGASAQIRDNEAALASGAYARSEQEAARLVRERVAGLAFDPDSLRQAEAQEQALAHWEEERQALAAARERLADDESALVGARARAAEAAADAERAEQSMAAAARELAEAPSYAARLAEVEREHSGAVAALNDLRARKGSLESEVRLIAEAAAELEREEERGKGIAEEIGAYGDLAAAFGKGGAQALLMEAAIPRIEDEANDLLRRMTDGRMTLHLETQRERRGGDAVETLDIVIGDELGTRAYEMFSGGERFRIDFAVRIALSRLLAWRAGATLPTLFIDEGFGTQDAEGRDRILEVIQAIEDRFERILVITHMDDIKEAFPVRIEVSRGAAGSTFALA